MPTHVYANNNEVASKAAEGKSLAAFPDVCFSPPSPPVGPIPLPYPNTGDVKDTDKGTAKVFIKDKMSGMAGDSYMTKSMGDESATQGFNKGMITGALQGKCCLGLWSMDVNMEGKGVPRHLDLVTHNHGSVPDNDPNGKMVIANFQEKNRYPYAIQIDNNLYYVKFEFKTQKKFNTKPMKYGMRLALTNKLYGVSTYSDVFETSKDNTTMYFYLEYDTKIAISIEGIVLIIKNHFFNESIILENNTEPNIVDTPTASQTGTDNEETPFWPNNTKNKKSIGEDEICETLKQKITKDMLDSKNIEIHKLAATAFAEASPPGNSSYPNHTFKEIPGIACALSNMAYIESISVLKLLERPKYARAAHDGNSQYYNLMKPILNKDISTINSNLLMCVALNSAKYAIARQHYDFSNGAYHWDGTDVRINKDQYRRTAGFRLSKSEHASHFRNEPNLDRYELNQDLTAILMSKTRDGQKEICRKDIKYSTAPYVSTKVIGDTIFWRLSYHYILTQGGHDRYLKDLSFK